MTAPRRLIALAGPPGAGKSTVADHLGRLFGGRVVPMDGYHLDNALLDEAGLRPKKGAPETFDTAGLFHALRRLRDGEAEVILPAFDRNRDAAIAGAIRIGPEDATLVVEGNYLLSTLPGWDRLAGLWDTKILLDVPRAELQRRLAARWQAQGLFGAAAAARIENDLANADLVARTSRGADLVVAWNPDEDPQAVAGRISHEAAHLLT